jgi:hypothetical protein
MSRGPDAGFTLEGCRLIPENAVLEYRNNGVSGMNSGWDLFDFYLDTDSLNLDPFPISPLFHYSTLLFTWQSQIEWEHPV